MLLALALALTGTGALAPALTLVPVERVNAVTDCESILWTKIRRKQIEGVQFYRQKPIGTFIVDFYSKYPKIVIELDGSQHLTDEHRAKDESRDAYLSTLGFVVLRFSNIEVLQQCEGVLFKIRETILALHPPAALRASAPLEGGEIT